MKAAGRSPGRKQRLRRALAEELFGERIGALAAELAERIGVQLLGVTKDDDARRLGLRRRRRQGCELARDENQTAAFIVFLSREVDAHAASRPAPGYDRRPCRVRASPCRS